jgi:DNA-binding NarL/FixJ family response regulator
MPITVLIADGDKTSRARSLNTLQPEKGISVVGVARNGLEAILAADEHKPNILLLNLNLFKGKGDNLLRALRHRSPHSRMILLTRRASQSVILEALTRGALGYLEEKAIEGFLPQAVRQVEAGQAWVPRKMAARIVDRLNISARDNGPFLSPAALEPPELTEEEQHMGIRSRGSGK